MWGSGGGGVGPHMRDKAVPYICEQLGQIWVFVPAICEFSAEPDNVGMA